VLNKHFRILNHAIITSI